MLCGGTRCALLDDERESLRYSSEFDMQLPCPLWPVERYDLATTDNLITPVTPPIISTET